MKIIRPFIVDDAAFVSSNVPENDYAAYSALTSYSLGQRVIFIATDVHRVYESLANGNLGNPVTDATKWLLVGNTNRWKAFDTSVQSQTTNADSISYELVVNERMDSVTFLNVSAATARVRMTDAIDGVVYDETYSLVSTSGINNWYSYFFEPIVRLTDLAVTDLSPYVNSTINIDLTDTGNTVALGALIMGLQRDVGSTLYGAKTGITDYSVKQQDDFGNYTVLERSFRKRSEMTVFVEAAVVDELQIILAGLRATPSVYIGTDTYTSTVIYGFYRDFDVTISYPTHSLLTITLEGLT
jgi:hypothetical protein